MSLFNTQLSVFNDKCNREEFVTICILIQCFYYQFNTSVYFTIYIYLTFGTTR